MTEQHNPQHWSQLDTEEQIRFWQGIDDGHVGSFLVSPEKKRTRRRRGEHSTKPKCENPSWFRPSHYKALGGQLGHAYNRLVEKDPATGQCRLRMHMSLHPFYVQERQRAGRRYAFRPEKQRLLDALWPVLVSFCDAGKHTVGMSVSRLARELSPKDARGEVISGTEVTVRRISALIAEQVRFGVLGVSEETLWDRESRKRLPKYVWITPVGWKMLGVDLMKLQEQQLKKLRECEERQALIKEGLLGEHEEISVLRARKRWYEQRSREALQYRRAKGAARKRANRLDRMPRDRQVYEMTCWLKKTLPADELYGYSKDKLEQLAVRHLYQLELSLNPSPPH
ncbi:plasmid replication initiator RepA [Klebsiella grimontii]|uniref:plasmid replication initiator RepA n=1 Tax=Klebsiella grimontii TaxID=2058152 RepID=UPI001052506E|nr:plasmid replication initiator RepA [Klebsiella grimontii]TCZ55653.1 replication initiation protein [Klebsiella grimontii]